MSEERPKRKAVKRLRSTVLERREGRGTMRMMESVLHIHQLLKGGNVVTMEQLKDELEVARATVQRYLDFLRDRLQADIIFDPDAGGYRYAGKQIPLPQPTLSEGDLIALYVAAPILDQYRGTRLGEQFQASFEKIVALLPERTRQRMYVVPGRVEVKARVPSKEDPVRFGSVLNALHRCRQIEMVYSPAYRKAMTTRVVDPYVLCVVEAKWYVIGYDHLRRRISTFAIDRIWTVKELVKEFQRPVGFSASEYLSDAFGIYLAPQDSGEVATEIVIKFDALAERYVKDTKWHHSQKIKPRSDGGIEMSFIVRGTIEIERFVLAWGEHAEVIAPLSLRNRMRERLAKTLTAYGGSPES